MPRELEQNHSTTAAPPAPVHEPGQDYGAWKSHCEALIYGATDGPVGYAIEWARRSKHGASHEVRAWLNGLGCGPFEDAAARRERVDQEVADLIATWRNWGGGKRKLGLALANGREVGRILAELYPGLTGIRLAQEATGEALPVGEQRARWHDTVAAMVEYLPAIPRLVLERWQGSQRDARGANGEEMDRRASRTDEARLRDADALAAAIMDERADLR